MNIVVGKEVADQLAERYTVLPLEKFVKDGVEVDAYCVVTADKINLGAMTHLDANIRLHQEFVDAYAREDWDRMAECDEHLRGTFGGELDTFYEELLSRKP